MLVKFPIGSDTKLTVAETGDFMFEFINCCEGEKL